MAMAASLSALPPSNGELGRSSSARVAMSVSRPVPPVDLPALQSASRVLQDQLLKDVQVVPELGDMLSIPGVTSSANYSVFPEDYRAPFQRRQHVAIPEGLFRHYNTLNPTTHMGLLPEIERVWISIDHNLFLWNYLAGEELSSYTEQPDVITHVALVKPKPGVFIDEISSLLVICTPVSVLLLGVSATSVPAAHGRSQKDVKLYATDMTVPTEVEMTSVVGTSDGRIFMAGVNDGNLYEFHYQEKEGWFGKRMQLINHSVGGMQSLLPRLAVARTEDRIVKLVVDRFRNCLYALTDRSTILIYRPGGEKAIQLSQTLSNLYKATQDKAPGSPALAPNTFRIIAVHVMEPGSSSNSPHLLALTTNGLRVYFAPSTSPYAFSLGPSTAPSQRPLAVMHVRPPPPNLLEPSAGPVPLIPSAPPIPAYGAPQPTQPPTRTYVVKNLEYSVTEAGTLVATQAGDTEGYDYIFALTPDLTLVGNLGQVSSQQQQPQQQPQPQPPQYGSAYPSISGPRCPPLTERANLYLLRGHTWDIAALPRSSMTAAAASPPDSPAPVLINDLATQFSEPYRQVLVLTDIGLTFFAKRRPVDSVKDVVEEFSAVGNPGPLIAFRDSYGRDQTCAMLLAVAAGNSFLDFEDQGSFGAIGTPSTELAAAAKQAFYDIGERPTWTERVTYGTSADLSGTATFSGRREGFALYFARLVRPLWKAKITKPGPGGQQQPNIADEILVVVQKNLQTLKDILDENPHLFHVSPHDYTNTRSMAVGEQEAWKAEQNSVSQLLMLLARTIEAISFVLLLTDHRIGELISQCEPAVQKTMTGLTFEQLITTQDGITASRALVNVIINQQIGQQISVDTISEVLQQRCGSFCSTDDVLLYKAKESVRKSLETQSPIERQRWLGESLRLFMKGARILDMEKLREICGDYQHLKYAKGAVELPLYCAQVMDPEGKGAEYWGAGLPHNDSRSEWWQRRSNCYDLVLDSLGVFEEEPAKAAGKPFTNAEDPEALRQHAYELAFSSEDEIFHSRLYDWLIEKKLSDELLDIRPPYLEAHLRREPATVLKYQLLWQFYVKDGQPLRAAEVLGALADSSDFDLPLSKRLEYLTLAVGNAKSHPVSAGGRHETAITFLTELEEKLEVAQVQLEMHATLYPRRNDPGEVGAKVQLLGKTLLTITELYQLYAEPFDLPIIKLLIFHVSGHRDENLVRPIWNKIFDDATALPLPPQATADKFMSQVISLGQRFYPSESAFPLRLIALLLVRFNLRNPGLLPFGWAPRVLIQCGVPYGEVWDIFHEMYESQIPPFNEQANVQAVSSDIAVLLTDWCDEIGRPQATPASRGDFPVYRIAQAVDQYLAELGSHRDATKKTYEDMRRRLRTHW